jgi:hypothetical protein
MGFGYAVELLNAGNVRPERIRSVLCVLAVYCVVGIANGWPLFGNRLFPVIEAIAALLAKTSAACGSPFLMRSEMRDLAAPLTLFQIIEFLSFASAPKA